MQIDLSLIRLRWLLLGAAALLVLLSLAVETYDSAFAPSWGSVLVPLLSLSYEHNLPTWWATSMLLCCALALTASALHARQIRAPHLWRWRVLAVLFAYISFDELVQLHEGMSDWFDTGGVLFFGWIIPAGAAVLVLGLWYLPFVRALPRRTRNQFVLAGVLYVSGALLMELPLGYWTERAGPDNLVYAFIDAIEEGLELSGTTLFLCALLERLAGSTSAIRITLTSAPER